MLTFGSTHCDFAGNIHVLTFGSTHCDYVENIHVLTFGSTTVTLLGTYICMGICGPVDRALDSRSEGLGFVFHCISVR